MIQSKLLIFYISSFKSKSKSDSAGIHAWFSESEPLIHNGILPAQLSRCG